MGNGQAAEAGLADSSQQLGSVIRSRRAAAGLTQEELADRSGVSVRTIRDIERGRIAAPLFATVRLLTKALGTPASHQPWTAMEGPGPGPGGNGRAGWATASSPAVRPAQLPAAIHDFTARDEETSALADLLTSGPGHVPGRGTVLSIVGMAGIGKTALAIRVAHQVAGAFTDGQLFVNLRGARAEVSHGSIAAQILRDLGMPPLPGHDDCVGQYHSMLAGRRLLIVLDDVLDAAQVRPLLPSTPACGMLITSRNIMISPDADYTVRLGTLPPVQAHELFTRIVGPLRATAEPDAVQTVVTACGGLPLAIKIAAMRLASRPSWHISEMARRLTRRPRPLDELSVGDLTVRAAFRRSYEALLPYGDRGTAAQEAFCLLSAQVGATFTGAAASAALGQGQEQAEQLLELLVDLSLLDSAGPGSYRFHPLLRHFAREHGHDQPAADHPGE
jgi:transcriptional regulator with XRE-family HTH domain